MTFCVFAWNIIFAPIKCCAKICITRIFNGEWDHHTKTKYTGVWLTVSTRIKGSVLDGLVVFLLQHVAMSCSAVRTVVACTRTGCVTERMTVVTGRTRKECVVSVVANIINCHVQCNSRLGFYHGSFSQMFWNINANALLNILCVSKKLLRRRW